MVVSRSTLSLLVSRIGTDHPYDALAPHHFAVAADLLDRCSDFHPILQKYVRRRLLTDALTAVIE